MYPGPKFAAGENVDLDMRVVLVDGDEVIADSAVVGGLAPACDIYKTWLHTK